VGAALSWVSVHAANDDPEVSDSQDYADPNAAMVRELHGKAERGDRTAQTILGQIYFGGLLAPQDYLAAAWWFRKAAEQGSFLAPYKLGLLYENGLGVPRDPAKAAGWYREGAKSGDR
jgi:hypothetical protein